jgi:hypothetical protein
MLTDFACVVHLNSRQLLIRGEPTRVGGCNDRATSWSDVSQTFFPWRNPLNNCSYPEELLPTNMKTQVRKRQLLKNRDYSSISNWQTKIIAIFRRIFIFFAVFQNSYVFIPLFLADPLTVFCGTLRFRGTKFEKHRSGVSRTQASLSGRGHFSFL